MAQTRRAKAPPGAGRPLPPALTAAPAASAPINGARPARRRPRATATPPPPSAPTPRAVPDRQIIKIRRTAATATPANNSLEPGELAVQMTDGRLWCGVPTSINPTGLRLLLDPASLAARALVIGGGAGAVPFSSTVWSSPASNNLVANFPALAGPPAMSVGGVQVITNATVQGGFQANSFGATPSIFLQRANGTPAAPTAIANNDRLMQLIVNGYGGSTYGGNTGIIDFIATQNWTETAKGTGLEFRTTGNGSVANNITLGVGLGGAGGITAPSNVTGGDLGTGNINVSGGYYVNGNPLPVVPTPGNSGGIPYYSSNTTLAASAALAARAVVLGGGPGAAPLTSTIWNSPAANNNLVGNFGGAPIPPGMVGTGLSIVGATGGQSTVDRVSYAAPSLSVMRRAEGTPTAQAAIAAAVRLAGIYAYGHDGSAFQQTAAITAEARQAFTGAARGTGWFFFGTPNGSTTIQSLMALCLSAGGLTLPQQPTGGDMGVGTINVSGGYYIGGVSILPVSVANGGTGLSGGTSGGVPYFSANNALASSAALAADMVVLGGGAGGAPRTSANWNAAAGLAGTFPATTTNILLRRSEGTLVAPTATALGRLGAIWGVGHDGANWQNVSAITIETRQAFTASARGTGFQFWGVQFNTAAITGLMALGMGTAAGSGGLSLPTSAADMGLGTVNAANGYYRAGTELLTPPNPGISGGIPYYSSNTAIGTSAALAARALVLGGGAGAAPLTSGVWSSPATNNLIANFPALGSPPTMLVGGVQVVANAAVQAGLQANSFGATTTLILQRANGTPAAPTVIANNDRLVQLICNGYGGSSYGGNTGIIDFIATQNWTETAKGTGLEFRTTVNGSIGNNINLGVGTGGAGGITAPSSVTGGDLGTGNINVSGGYFVNGEPLSTALGSAFLPLAGGTMTGASPSILWPASGVGVPSFTTRSAGTKLVLYPGVGAAAVDFALGISGGTLWQSVNTTGSQFQWYAAQTLVATLSGLGDLSITRNFSAANVTATGSVASAGGFSSSAGGLDVAAASVVRNNFNVTGALGVTGNMSANRLDTTTWVTAGDGFYSPSGRLDVGGDSYIRAHLTMNAGQVTTRLGAQQIEVNDLGIYGNSPNLGVGVSQWIVTDGDHIGFSGRGMIRLNRIEVNALGITYVGTGGNLPVAFVWDGSRMGVYLNGNRIGDLVLQ